MIILDTNALLRLILRDNENQFQLVLNTLNKGDSNIVLLKEVIFEFIFVLKSVYKYPSEKIANIIYKLIQTEKLELEESNFWDFFVENTNNKLSPQDLYLLYLNKTKKYRILTFDKDLLKKLSS